MYVVCLSVSDGRNSSECNSKRSKFCKIILSCAVPNVIKTVVIVLQSDFSVIVLETSMKCLLRSSEIDGVNIDWNYNLMFCLESYDLKNGVI